MELLWQEETALCLRLAKISKEEGIIKERLTIFLYEDIDFINNLLFPRSGSLMDLWLSITDLQSD